MAEHSLLIIDDDEELCELLTDYLSKEGFEVDTVHRPEPGLERALSEPPSLVVLDVMLPGMSGFELLRRLRETSRIPVLMLTARGDDVDRIVGLEMGADDYLPKPFNPRELVARIRAIQRRAPARSTPPDAHRAATVRVGDVELDPGTRTVRHTGEPVELTSVEFDLLGVFLTEAGRAVHREDLAHRVLGRDLGAFDRSIDVHVSNLRKKLGPREDGIERIRSIRGVGYQYAAMGDDP